MTRHNGIMVDASAGTIRYRDGQILPADRIVNGGSALYFAAEWPHHRRFRYHESWLVPAEGWAVSRFTHRPDAEPFPFDWYIDIDHVGIEGHLWRVADRFLDVVVHEGHDYEVVDADELADGIDLGEIGVGEATAALRSLNALCRSLARLDFSVRALLAEYAPGLPA